MKVVHVLWQPDPDEGFIQSGQMCVWVEDSQHNQAKSKPETPTSIHPSHLPHQQLIEFIDEHFKLSSGKAQDSALIAKSYPVELPSHQGKPLSCPELESLVEEQSHDAAYSLQNWQVECLSLDNPMQALNQIHYLGQYPAGEYRLGSDFLFWFYFTAIVRRAIERQQYIPSLVQADLPPAKKGKAEKPIYRCWQIVSAEYEAALQNAAQRMPMVCAQGYEPLSLLQHCAQVMVNQHLTRAGAKIPQTIQKKFAGTVFEAFFNPEPQVRHVTGLDETIVQWTHWQQKINDLGQNNSVQLCFRLQGPQQGSRQDWTIHFLVASRQDPSFRLALDDYWAMSVTQKNQLTSQFGPDLELQVLSALGSAARIYPRLWQGMSTRQPTALSLSLEAAFEFLKQTAWVLEDAGFKVIVPSWWTPKGRQRAKVRLRSKGKSSGDSQSSSQGILSLGGLVEYNYELAIGDTPITPAEWTQLVEAKSPLIAFRGQWMELEPDKMAHMLAFWQRHGNEIPQAPMSELIKILAEQSDTFELPQNDALSQMLGKLFEPSQLKPIDDPQKLNATLRDYQKRGVSWLRYLEQLGLNGCLADDMGLGKTIQVIANMVLAEKEKVGPTLLIAPTSVMGNWQKEVEKFAPQLKTTIHHGTGRLQEGIEFGQLCHAHDMVITSYSLVRRDTKLLDKVHWQRIVLDEAQNIKNPKAEQTKAIFKLKAASRLALTGTPVENRLMDLWSIFNFLNPGYLGSQTQFRKQYEIPIQRDNDFKRSAILKRLIEPFILRRMKTDKNIIQDLPDKIDNKQYCNLSKEQAALYEVVVNDVSQKLADKEGIERQGLMLSTLTKLKQICNHPMQFLQDSSEFTPERSHKLERLGEMLEEANAEGDSVLIFTQFTEIGEKLKSYLSRDKQLACYYLHGGVTRQKREAMISEFQDPTSAPAVFILSLKAGGVGITLTRANHVFHFDRWWNPAVENQATDRAFRIGQKKQVFVHKFITLGTLEERIDEMIETKKQLADAVIGNDENWLTKLNNDEFKSLIALNKQAIVE